MNVIHLARRFVRHEWGGVETAVLETAKRMPALGCRPQIVASAALAGEGRERIDGVDVTRHRHMYPYWGLSAEARQAMDKKGGNLFSLPLLRWLQQQPLDVLHVHTLNRLGAVGRYVARRRRVPYVVSIHGGVHDLPASQAAQMKAPAKGAVEWGKVIGWWLGSRRVLRDAAAVICYGRGEYELTCRRLPKTRVEMMPHGVDVGRFRRGDGDGFRRAHGIAPQDRVLLTVARIDPQKDQLLAVQALPAVLRAEPQALLVLMGPVTNHDYLAEIQQAARRLGVSSRVRILPGVDPADPRLVDAYHAADVFLLPSMHEVFGIVVLEAWAAGVPVVASNIGGIASLVRDGRDGLLFPSGEGGQLAQQCLRMLGDAELAGMIQVEASDRVRREFSWETVTAKLVELYREVAHEPVAVG